MNEWPSTNDPGIRKGSFLSPSTIFRCWKENRRVGLLIAFDRAESAECFTTLRRHLESEYNKEGEGVREYIRVLRLLENHSMPTVQKAVEKALKVRAYRFEAVCHFLRSHSTFSPPVFRLDGREHLAFVRVASPDISAYRALAFRRGEA